MSGFDLLDAAVETSDDGSEIFPKYLDMLVRSIGIVAAGLMIVEEPANYLKPGTSKNDRPKTLTMLALRKPKYSKYEVLAQFVPLRAAAYLERQVANIDELWRPRTEQQRLIDALSHHLGSLGIAS